VPCTKTELSLSSTLSLQEEVQMRNAILLFGAMLLLSVAASAQDERIATVAAPIPPASPEPASVSEPLNDTAWQFAFSYQYNRINLTGKRFNTEGFNVSAVRFFYGWVGLEVNMGAGFGNTHSSSYLPNLDAKTLFAAGGLHLSHRTGRVEPWVHALEGMELFRFTQTATLGSNPVLAWEAGGGFDFYLNGRTAIRTQADYLGTHLGPTFQRNFQAGAGLVIDF
jgi:hypothetical protein